MATYMPPIPRSVGAIASPKTAMTPVASANGTANGTAHGNAHDTKNGIANGSAHSYAQDHWTRYDQLKGVEDAKNSLIEDILCRYDAVVQQCKTLAEEQNAQGGHHNGLSKEQAAFQQEQADFIVYLQDLMNGNPFVTVIIDGNSLFFDDAFIREGEKGGRRAAVFLKHELTEWLPKSIEHPPSNFKVMIKVYADFKGLAGTYMRAGIIESPSSIGEFTRGFNTLFDFIDIGGGDVNSKITENLQLFLHDYHCHQVILGGSAQVLKDNVEDPRLGQRVALLQTMPSETEHPFKTVWFPQVFRSNKIPAGITNNTPHNETPVFANITPRTDTPVSVASTGNGHLPVLPFHTRTNSVASSVTSAEVHNGPKTWAKLAQDVAAAPLTSAVTRTPDKPILRHNKKGQRIDPPFDFDLEALARVKKIKMCNMHYLHPDGCKWSASKCNHRHDYKPTLAEINLLRCVSRETPCQHGVGCEELVCVYGHRCPFPPATEGSMRFRSCIFGEKCRFPPEFHGIKDSAPARSTKH